jgi:IS605 OrfB family transposase
MTVNIDNKIKIYYNKNKKKGCDILQLLTIKIRFFPTNPTILKKMSQEYIQVVNQLTQQAAENNSFPKITTKDVKTVLPSAICNQAIRDAKSVFNKYRKTKKLSILKNPVYYINNQNYTILDNVIAFPISINNKTKKTYFKAIPTEKDMKLIKKSKLGLMRIVEKSGKWYAQVSIQIPEQENVNSENIMGVDLGLKVPAVAVTSTGKTRFFGNGRQIKYIRRKYQSRRKKLGKLKKLHAIKKLGNKESRWMKDQNHKISRQIVNFAIQENVSVIKLESLANIRQTTRKSRKNAKNLHNWSFYQLQKFIEYKANLAGIKVVYVNPAYTSQTCPCCGTRNHANDRKYECQCGFKAHRDRVGAINIMNQPVADGVA